MISAALRPVTKTTACEQNILMLLNRCECNADSMGVYNEPALAGIARRSNGCELCAAASWVGM